MYYKTCIAGNVKSVNIFSKMTLDCNGLFNPTRNVTFFQYLGLCNGIF